MSYLIKDTTREEREKIVADSLGYIEANCDGCMTGLVEMYQDYIDGKKNSGTLTWHFMQAMSAERMCRRKRREAEASAIFKMPQIK